MNRSRIRSLIDGYPSTIRIGSALTLSALIAWSNPAYAQSGGVYLIAKSTIDGGGATMTGDIYRLHGTVGQPDAGFHSGGDFTLTGGFWSPQPEAPPAPLANPVGVCSGNNAVCDVELNNCPPPQTCRPWDAARGVSFVIPSVALCADSGPGESAFRVRLAAMHHIGQCSITTATTCNVASQCPPAEACLTFPRSGRCSGNGSACNVDSECMGGQTCVLTPLQIPDFSSFEGQARYVNAIPGIPLRCCDTSDNPITCHGSAVCDTDSDCTGLGDFASCVPDMCPDSLAFSTYYVCAQLGCLPDFREWIVDHPGQTIYVFGDTLVPSSDFEIAHLSANCKVNPDSCSGASIPVVASAGRWADINGNDAMSAVDVALVVDKVKNVVGAVIEPRALLQGRIPVPLDVAVSALDIGHAIDANKGLRYPFNLQCSTTTACGDDSDCTPPATCSANGRCTTVEDICGWCNP